MEPMVAKRVGKDSFQSKRHVPPAVVGSKCVIPEIAGLKVATNDFADADHTGKITGICSNPVRHVYRRFDPPEPVQKSLRRAGSRNPGMMQLAASFHCSQKFTLAFHRRFFESDLHGSP